MNTLTQEQTNNILARIGENITRLGRQTVSAMDIHIATTIAAYSLNADIDSKTHDELVTQFSQQGDLNVQIAA